MRDIVNNQGLRQIGAILWFVLLNQWAFSEHFVVLGSYQDRGIAIDELRGLDQELDPLLISVREHSDGVYYRVVAGPFRSFVEAQQSGRLWQNQGVNDAWIVQMPIPPRIASPEN